MPRPDTHDNPEITIDTASTSSSSYSISTRSRNAQTVASSSASISSSSDDEYEVPVQFLAPEDNGEVRQRRSSVASSASFASLASIAIFDTVPEDHKLDIRANERTFDGAYLRTALEQLAFALVVLKIFSREFIPIGTVFTIQGIMILFISLYRRSSIKKFIINKRGHYKPLPKNQTMYFETSGPTVVLLSITTILTYIALLVLLYLM